MTTVLAVFHLAANQVEIGPNLLAFLLALLAFLGTAFTAWQTHKLRQDTKPNGGTTSRDALQRIEQHAAAVSAKIAPEAAAAIPPDPTTPPGGVPVTLQH